jgi:hypothetical protein
MLSKKPKPTSLVVDVKYATFCSKRIGIEQPLGI